MNNDDRNRLTLALDHSSASAKSGLALWKERENLKELKEAEDAQVLAAAALLVSKGHLSPAAAVKIVEVQTAEEVL